MSREEAIKDIEQNILPIVGGKSLLMAIEALKEQKNGKWIVEKDAAGYRYGRCSECGMTQYAGKLNYCPNCGAKMEVEE